MFLSVCNLKLLLLFGGGSHVLSSHLFFLFFKRGHKNEDDSIRQWSRL
ncbi:hypothetical protein LINPERPRIM_LOCUS5309 [Linum perenne]